MNLLSDSFACRNCRSSGWCKVLHTSFREAGRSSLHASSPNPQAEESDASHSCRIPINSHIWSFPWFFPPHFQIEDLLLFPELSSLALGRTLGTFITWVKDMSVIWTVAAASLESWCSSALPTSSCPDFFKNVRFRGPGKEVNWILWCSNMATNKFWQLLLFGFYVTSVIARWAANVSSLAGLARCIGCNACYQLDPEASLPMVPHTVPQSMSMDQNTHMGVRKEKKNPNSRSVKHFRGQPGGL